MQPDHTVCHLDISAPGTKTSEVLQCDQTIILLLLLFLYIPQVVKIPGVKNEKKLKSKCQMLGLLLLLLLSCSMFNNNFIIVIISLYTPGSKDPRS